MDKFCDKIPNYDSFGGQYNHITAMIKLKFGKGALLTPMLL